MTTYNVISADSHVSEPPEVWAQYIEPAFKARAPYMKREPQGDMFYCEGLPTSHMGLVGPAGVAPKDMVNLTRFDQGNRKGGWDPNERLKDQAADGVDAEVLYPSVGMRMFRLKEGPFQRALFRAYNRWIADYCKTHPDHYRAVGMINTDEVELAIADLHEARQLGLGGAMIAQTPKTEPYSSKRYDPLWAAAQSLEIPVSLHIVTDANRMPGDDLMIEYASWPYWVQRTLSTLIFSGVLDRFPSLKVVSVENDIGWVGNYLQRVDNAFYKHAPRKGSNITSGRMPSEIFRQQVYCTFINDRSGMRLWDLIGEDNIMWSSDYPHIDSTWPNSQKAIERDFVGVPEPVKRKVLRDNAARLYHFN